MHSSTLYIPLAVPAEARGHLKDLRQLPGPRQDAEIRGGGDDEAWWKKTEVCRELGR